MENKIIITDSEFIIVRRGYMQRSYDWNEKRMARLFRSNLFRFSLHGGIIVFENRIGE